jgi:iron transport multicopper oxidase
MTSGTDDYFQAVDGSRAAEALITSILINGRGQYFDPRNNDSSTTPLERLIISESDTQYRIRLINGGSAFSLTFSIDEHPLQVVSSDGIPFDQPVLVDQIVVGLGERFDLIINVTSTADQNSCKL